MITLDRLVVRQARAVFRKLVGRKAQDAGTPLTIISGPEGLILKLVAPQGAARFHQAGSGGAVETLRAPLSLLDDCQASRAGPVTLERVKRGTLTAQWTEGRVPQLIEYGEAELSPAADYPVLPPSLSSQPPELLSALGAAMETVDSSTVRQTLNCIQLSGTKGRITATDGRHVFVQDGFEFGWQEDVLVPANPVFGCRELPQDQPVQLGITASWLTARIGSWLISLPRQLDGIFPDVDSAIPSLSAATTTASLAAEDIQFLRQSLAKFRSEDGLDLPLTIDLNGSVAIRCQPTGQPKPTQLILSNSIRDGQPVSFNASRTRVLRALDLGLDKLHFSGPEAPVIWQRGNRRYAWAAFPADALIPASKEMIRLASAIGSSHARISRRSRRCEVPSPTKEVSPSMTQPTAAKHVVGKRRCSARRGSIGADGLIKGAEALQASLREALLRTRELIAGLKRHRRQTRMVRSTLSSLKELQGIGA